MAESLWPIAVNLAEFLIRFADPCIPADGLIISDAASLESLVALAEQHSVLPVVWRKLRERNFFGLDSDPGISAVIQRIDRAREMEAGQSMMLLHYGKRISDMLTAAGVSFAMVKGRVFATKLYPHVSDRPFSDIDFLVSSDDIDAVSAVMAANGFRLRTDHKNYSDDLLENKWTHVDQDWLLIEVHENLMHSPRIRRRISFGYADIVRAGEGNPEAREALLLTAILHLACGHKFSNLRLLVDVLQAARNIPVGDEAAFARAVILLNAQPETAVALDLAVRIFGDDRARDLAGLFGSSSLRSAGRHLLTTDAILNAPDRKATASRLRRDAFRLLQYMQ